MCQNWGYLYPLPLAITRSLLSRLITPFSLPAHLSVPSLSFVLFSFLFATIRPFLRDIPIMATKQQVTPDPVDDGPPISVPDSEDTGETGKLKMIVQLVRKCMGIKDIASMSVSAIKPGALC